MTQGRGTPYFSAPEQLTSSTYDTPADVWALGCILTCLWTDREYPYPIDDDIRNQSTTIVSRIMTGDLRPSLPQHSSMHSFVRDCCRYSPARRIDAATLELQLSKEARMFSLSHLSEGGGREQAAEVELVANLRHKKDA